MIFKILPLSDAIPVLWTSQGDLRILDAFSKRLVSPRKRKRHIISNNSTTVRFDNSPSPVLLETIFFIREGQNNKSKMGPFGPTCFSNAYFHPVLVVDTHENAWNSSISSSDSRFHMPGHTTLSVFPNAVRNLTWQEWRGDSWE